MIFTRSRKAFTLTVLCSTLLLGACDAADKAANDALSSLSAISGLGETEVVEDFQIWTLNSDGAPQQMVAGDAQLKRALQAMLAQVRGHSQADVAEALNVEITPNSALEDANLDSLQVSRALVLGDVTVSPDQTVREVAGVFAFNDDAGRNASLGYSLSFSPTQNMAQETEQTAEMAQAIALQDATAAPLYAGQPGLSLFVTPVKAIDKSGKFVVTNYDRFYDAVTQAALPIREGTNLPGGPGDYLFIAFIQDQLAPGDSLSIEYLNRPDQKTGDSTNSFYRAYDDGWAVAMLRRTIDITQSDEGWIRVSMMPAADGPRADTAPRPVGLFAAGSQKNVLQRAQSSAKGE